MSEINYAIPSHRRANSISEKTLKMLADNRIAKKDIKIFLSDPDDAVAYQNIADRGYQLIVTDAINVVAKFNAIHDHYEPGSHVVFIEDDIECLKRKGEGKNELLAFAGLKKLAEDNFASCEHFSTKLWGISSNANPFYMKDQKSVGFKFIVANLFGFISTQDPFLKISQQMKSDYERTLLYFVKFGQLLRSDGVCAITKNYKNEGGLQEIKEHRAHLERAACEYLVERFPHLIQVNEKKSATSMYMELKLITQKRGVINDWMAIQKRIDAGL